MTNPINGTERPEVLEGTDEDDTIRGNGGDDTLRGNGGDDWLYGGSGDNTLEGGDGDDRLFGGGHDGVDTLDGGAGNDELWGGGGGDTLRGGKGDDWLYGGAGKDKLYGGGGVDYASYYSDGNARAEVGVIADLFNVVDDPDTPQDSGYRNTRGVSVQGNAGGAKDDRYHGVENLYGTIKGDELYGNDVANTLWGAGGDDKLYGRDGNDELYGGADCDTLYGGKGDDWLYGNAGADDLYGGAGDNDYASYAYPLSESEEDAGVVADLFNVVDDPDNPQPSSGYRPASGFVPEINRGEAAGDRYHGIENLYGTRKGDDELYGNDVANTLWGGGGRDKLYGRGGNDTLRGGAGDDTLVGDAGDDRLRGGNGDDTLRGGDGNDEMRGGAGDDTLDGGDGNDEMRGGAGDDTLDGGAGDDFLRLGGGSDTVVFGRGDGHDTVAADGFDAASTDKVMFGSGVKSDDLWFEESGADLKISVVGESDSLTLKDWFKSSITAAGRMDEFHLSSGEVLIESRVQELVEKMAGWSRDHGAGPAGLGELPDNEDAYGAFTSALDTAWQSPASG